MTIFEKIEKAKRLYKEFGKDVVSDPEINALLSKYRKEIINTQEMMLDLGIVKACAFCDANTPGGSCCGKGIEDWYDEILLLINMLLGCDIPLDRRGDNDCLFLGERGCLLIARNYFCVNYLCKKIWKGLDTEALSMMQGQAGRELSLSWLIDEKIKKIIGIQH